MADWRSTTETPVTMPVFPLAAAFDLGAGIDVPVKNNHGFLLDFRWRWLVDYAGKRETIGVAMLSAGIRFASVRSKH